MNTIVTAEIDVATPTGRRIIKELEQYKRTVKLNYPESESITGKTYTVDEAFDIVGRRLSRNYGVEIKID
ncbi:hypothetical protein FACS189432_02370 [Bacteroidia bacterium]|nr:hypothetical protein FACS189426_00430 [Bacteroidia bacterium]GHT26943.1 hypothetical protein FACS189432_02370 [Bacteroidia bacterium]